MTVIGNALVLCVGPSRRLQLTGYYKLIKALLFITSVVEN